MPRASSITTELLAEIAQRRRAGETWKSISADLRARGVTADRSHLWRVFRQRRDVAQHLHTCATPEDRATP